MRRTCEILSESKRVFGGELDREKLADLLLKHRPLGKIRWLEVGVGDGKNLQYLLDIVCGGEDFVVTGIDPQLNADEFAAERRFEFIRSSFEAFAPLGKFDIINARHSIYYFGDERCQISRFPDMLGPHGRLAITAWTEDCVLYALHHAIARQVGVSPSNVTATTANSLFEEVGLNRIANHVAIGNVNAKYATPEQLASIVELAARKIDLTHVSRTQRTDIAREFFLARRDLRRHTSVSLYAQISRSN